MDKLALGLYIDGLTVQAALVCQNEGLYQVESLESFKLYDPLEQKERTKSTDKDGGAAKNIGMDEDEDPFAFDFDVRPDQSSDLAQKRGNVDALIEMISKMAPVGCPIAFNLLAPYVHYKVIQVDDKTSKAKIKKLIWSELNENTEDIINPQNIGIINIEGNFYLGMVHKDTLALSSLLGETFKLMKRAASPIILIDTIEFALAEYISKTTNLTEQDRSAVVLFSHNYTKIFFMKGKSIENILPTIHTGSKSTKICETAFSKILYEFDFKGIDSPQTIILAGEVDQVQAETFFVDKFPNLNIIKLETNESFLAPNIQVLAGKTSPYSVATALAVKSLQSNKLRTYKQNYLPKRIKERQSQFVVAWHGFAMMGILFLTILFLFTQNLRILNSINKTKKSLNQTNLELANLKNVEHDVDSIRLEISNIEKGAALIDSLGRERTRWSPSIESFSEAFKAIGSFSINKFVSVSKEKMVVEIELSNLKQVAELERFIEKSKVLSVLNKITDEKEEIHQLTIECDLSGQNKEIVLPPAAVAEY